MTVARTRVLFAIPMLDRGGPDRVFAEVIRKLDRDRFEPSVLVSQPHGQYLDELPSDVPVTILGEERSARDRYPLLRALRHIRMTRPDVVASTLRMNLTLGAIAPLLPRGTRLVMRPASPVTADMDALAKLSLVKHRLAKRLLVAALRQADTVICQSSAMQSDLRATLGSRARLEVIWNPIDVDEVDRTSGTARATIAGAPALVSVGRLVTLKGFDLLLRALVLLRSRHAGLHLTILGDGPEQPALEALARELGVAAMVTFAGYSRAPWPLVRAADLFVLASRYDAFPNAALEALACGTPIVLTDCPGASAELVCPGVNGRLAAAADPGAIATAIEAALAERSHYDPTVIRDDVRTRFASPVIVRGWERVLATRR